MNWSAAERVAPGSRALEIWAATLSEAVKASALHSPALGEASSKVFGVDTSAALASGSGGGRQTLPVSHTFMGDEN